MGGRGAGCVEVQCPTEVASPATDLRDDEEDDLLDDRDLSDDEKGMMRVPQMDGSEAFHQVVKEMLLNGHQVRAPRGVGWGVVGRSQSSPRRWALLRVICTMLIPSGRGVLRQRGVR